MEICVIYSPISHFKKNLIQRFGCYTDKSTQIIIAGFPMVFISQTNTLNDV